MKKMRLMIEVAFLVATVESAKAVCWGVGYPMPSCVVFENELFARVRLYRDGSTDRVQSVDYVTADGFPGQELSIFPAQPGKAGVHYVAQSGTATFGIGQRTINVDIPLIDNGSLDGFKDFRIVLTNASPVLALIDTPDQPWIRIEDNELGSALDPLFDPDIMPDSPSSFTGGPAFASAVATAMPDGRILVSTAARLKRLQPSGWLDRSFAFRDQFQPDWRGSGQVLSDGKILAIAEYTTAPKRGRCLIQSLATTSSLQLSLDCQGLLRSSFERTGSKDKELSVPRYR